MKWWLTAGAKRGETKTVGAPTEGKERCSVVMGEE